MKGLRVYITGNPGVGKTTLFFYIVTQLKNMGYNVQGFYCPEVRENGVRIGFKIRSLDGEVEDWLAHVNIKSNIKIGKYYVVVNEDTINKISEKIKNSQIIGIDEIGPMELSVPKLRELIDNITSSNNNLIAVIHRKIKMNDGKVFVVDENNRDNLRKEILNYIIAHLK